VADWETRFPKPDDALTHELVADALRAAGSSANPASWEWIDHGSANLIVLTGPIAVRLSRTSHEARDSVRVQALIDALPPLPFAVPRSLSEPVTAQGLVAQAQDRLAGEPHPAGSGDPTELRRLLDALHEVDPSPIRTHLAPARHFIGGPDWYEVMTASAIPLLDVSVRALARRIADSLAALDAAPRTLNHGDLAGANVLWANGRVVGVLDWDLAAVDDPSEDVAALGSWHTWPVIARAVSGDVLRRAEAFRDSFPLQLVCHALIAGRDRAELDRAVARANRRLQHT